jgi:hypothetical protein
MVALALWRNALLPMDLAQSRQIVVRGGIYGDYPGSIVLHGYRCACLRMRDPLSPCDLNSRFTRSGEMKKFAVLVAILTLGLVGCAGEDTATKKAVDDANKAAAEAAKTGADAAKAAGEAAKAAGEAAKTAAEDASSAIKDAAAGAAAADAAKGAAEAAKGAAEAPKP